MPTTRHNEPTKRAACPPGPQVSPLGAALLWGFGFIVACGSVIFALVTLWEQSLF
jgi:hypothetical protein